jgi:hypothetical protein
MMKKLLLLALSSACSVETVTDPGVVEPVPTEATWSVDQTTDGALLGVWGHGPDDVWAVGGNLDQPLVMHNDGTAWRRLAVPGSSLLWNVYGFRAADAYAVGDNGLILHYDGDTWTQVPSGTNATLFGLWGASGDDVWIVGRDLTTNSAVVLRGTDDGFTPVTTIPTELRPTALYKAHGFAPDDVVMVGDGGALRWNGSEWRKDAVPTNEPLRSAWGRNANDVYAVGGRGVAEILHSDGDTWSLVTELPIGWGLTSVFTAPNEPTLAVGGSYVFEVGTDGNVAQPALPDISATPTLHGVWGDGLGTAYVVGANMSTSSSMRGVILRRQ